MKRQSSSFLRTGTVDLENCPCEKYRLGTNGLREMLTDTSESESEEKYGRFAESGRWITELYGVFPQATTTSRGECSGRGTPDSS